MRDGNHTPRTVTLAHVPGAGTPAPGDRFGAALASGMVHHARPCNDVLAGAPGRNMTGEAFLLGGSTGARPRDAVVFRAPDAAPGDAFGAAVAISPRAESETTTCGSARRAATSPGSPTRARSTTTRR